MRILTLSSLVFIACGSPATQQNVELLFTDFQPTLQKIINNGLAAKDASTSGANITPVTGNGDKQGTFTIGGKVAQGTGLNQNLGLWVQLDADYSDTGKLFYNTDNTSDATKLQLDIQIQNQPQDNTMSGTLVGPLTLKGDVQGSANFNLTFKTDLTDDDAAPETICSHVTGSVSAGAETKTVDFVIPADQADVEKCKTL
jgi:hypothetical protein